MGDFFGKFNCGLYQTPAKNVANDIFKSIFDVLSAQSGSGKVTRIAYNVGLSGSGTDYWDEANPFGNNAWACFRFNSSSNRGFEWYMLIQMASGSGNFGDSPGNPGLLNGVAEAQSSTEGSVGIAIASLYTSSGSSGNPWNGTTNNDGTDLKGDPVWNTSSIDDMLYVLPRSNGKTGLHRSSRQNMAKLYSSTISLIDFRYNIIASEDGFLFVSSDEGNNLWSVAYIGTYNPSPHLTSSIPNPLIMFVQNHDGQNILSTTDIVGNTNGTGIFEGGLAAQGDTYSFGIDSYTNKLFANAGDYTDPSGITGHPVLNSMPIPLVLQDDTAQRYGFAGYLDNEMYRIVIGAPNGSITQDKNKAVFGDSATQKTAKVVVPWTGSVLPPRSLVTRRGEDV